MSEQNATELVNITLRLEASIEPGLRADAFVRVEISPKYLQTNMQNYQWPHEQSRDYPARSSNGTLSFVPLLTPAEQTRLYELLQRISDRVVKEAYVGKQTD